MIRTFEERKKKRLIQAKYTSNEIFNQFQSWEGLISSFVLLSNNGESTSGFYIRDMLTKVAEKLENKDKKIVVFLGVGYDTDLKPEDIKGKRYFFGRPESETEGKLVSLSIKKLYGLFDNIEGSICLRNFFESLYYRAGIGQSLTHFDFNNIEDKIETNKILDFMKTSELINSIEESKEKNAWGNFLRSMDAGGFSRLFDENSNVLDELLNDQDISIIYYSTKGFKYYEEFPAFLSFLLLYSSEKLKSMGKEGIFLLDYAQSFLQFQEYSNGRFKLSEFSETAIKSARGGRTFVVEKSSNNKIIAHFPQSFVPSYHEKKYCSSVIQTIIEPSLLAVFDLSSKFRQYLEKYSNVSLISLYNIVKLGKAQQEWDEEKNEIPYLIGGLDYLQLIKDNEKLSEKLVLQGRRFKGQNTIEEILEKETSDYVKICDPYFQATTVEFLEVIPKGTHIKILSENTGGKSKGPRLAKKIKQLQKINRLKIEIKKLRPFPAHMRYIITKGKGWHLSHSLKDFGKKDSLIQEIKDELKTIGNRFDELWDEAEMIELDY